MTIEKFAEKWQQQHYPTMDLQAEVPFYYDIYQEIGSAQGKAKGIQLVFGTNRACNEKVCCRG